MEENIQTVEVARETRTSSKVTKPVRILAGVVAVALDIALAAIGIAWLSSIVAVLASGTIFGYDVLLGFSPVILAILITASLFIAFWPISILAKGFWSLAKGKNKYDRERLMAGGILFALSIAAVVIIAVNLGKHTNLDIRDGNTRVIIDDGVVCVSKTGECDK